MTKFKPFFLPKHVKRSNRLPWQSLQKSNSFLVNKKPFFNTQYWYNDYNGWAYAVLYMYCYTIKVCNNHLLFSLFFRVTFFKFYSQWKCSVLMYRHNWGRRTGWLVLSWYEWRLQRGPYEEDWFPQPFFGSDLHQIWFQTIFTSNSYVWMTRPYSING